MSTGEVGSPTEPPTSPVDLGPVGPEGSGTSSPRTQEAVIGDLAGKMRFVGAFLFAMAMLGFALQGALFIAWIAEGTGTGSLDVDSGLINVLIYGLDRLLDAVGGEGSSRRWSRPPLAGTCRT